MLRLLTIALIIYALVVLWRRVGSKSRPSDLDDRGLAKPGEMVACFRCGTFVLLSEAIKNGGHFYCSEDCRSKPKGNT